jgi:hypothetical protein
VIVHFGRFFLKIIEAAHFFTRWRLGIVFDKRCFCVTFWAIFSQTHLVTVKRTKEKKKMTTLHWRRSRAAGNSDQYKPLLLAWMAAWSSGIVSACGDMGREIESRHEVV